MDLSPEDLAMRVRRNFGVLVNDLEARGALSGLRTTGRAESVSGRDIVTGLTRTMDLVWSDLVLEEE